MEEFKQIETFEEILSNAKNAILATGKDYLLNFSLKVDIDMQLIKNPQLLDVTKKAEEWQNFTRPQNLHINHGEYIGPEGVPYVIDELKRKNKSNRAVISLISQEHIIGKGDSPIPSFMILQFYIDDKTLYVTTYFRALEVTNFLRINLEEIRMICQKIYRTQLELRNVFLNIFAFRAYISEGFSNLERPEFDTLEEAMIFTLLMKSPTTIVQLLRAKLEASNSSVIETESLEIMQKLLTNTTYSEMIELPCLKTPLLLDSLNSSISFGKELMDLRKQSSYSQEITEANEKYNENLRKVIEEVEKCLLQ